jgi:hypothetical protein
MREAEGVPLPGGRMTSGLVRLGDRVRRPTGPWSPAVHEYLRHLASAGFEGSPRVLATGDGWEELTYVEGEVAADAAWAFVPLAPPAQLAQAGFDPLPDLPERLRLFVDAYGLTDRAPIVPALQRAPLASAERVRYAPVDAAGAADALEFLAGQLRWIHGISAGLARAL